MAFTALCAHCQGPATLLPVLSSVSTIDFFLCDRCGRVSERRKGLGGEPVIPEAPLHEIRLPEASAPGVAGQLMPFAARSTARRAPRSRP
jgi:hypothetical protein